VRTSVLLTAALLLAACGRGEDEAGGAPAASPAPTAPAAADPSAPRAQTPTYATPAPADRGPLAEPLVALVPSDDAAITASLAAGLRLAFAEARAAGGPDLALQVSTTTAAWGSAVEGAVRDAVDTDAIALVAPPERRHAHLLVQLGTRVHLPVVSTSPARSVVGAGSSWVVAVVPTLPGVGDGAPVPPPFDAGASFAAAFRAAEKRDAGPWDAAGYDAGRAIVEAVRRNGLHRRGLLGALVHGEAVRGASGEFAFDACGGRRGAVSAAAESRGNAPESAESRAIATPVTAVPR
jgi:hypothetical protein